MKENSFLGLFLPIFLISCSASTDSNQSLQFENMNIEYSKVGGWINRYKLNIDEDGLTRCYEITHASMDTIDADSVFLNEREKEKLGELFATFQSFNSNYEPAQYYSDGNYHTIILYYEGRSDTVTVYEPRNCIIPKDLKDIITIMEQKLQSVLN